MSDSMTRNTGAEMTAQRLNGHLADNGVVQVTTYARSWLYDKRHIGWFTEANGQLFVRDGKRTNCLGSVSRPMVAIRLVTYRVTR